MRWHGWLTDPRSRVGLVLTVPRLRVGLVLTVPRSRFGVVFPCLRVGLVLTLALGACATQVFAQQKAWRRVDPVGHVLNVPAQRGTMQSRPTIKLGRPEPLTPYEAPSSHVTLSAPQRIVRAQGFETPPPPPPPPPVGTPVGPGGVGPLGEEAYNCGVVSTPAAGGAGHGWWQRLGDNIKGCWDGICGGVGNTFQAGPGGEMFRSDHHFDGFISPLTNPFYFEDPRALTELRPIFIWQRTPSGNPIAAGGDNFVMALQGRLAFNEYLSLTVHKFGWVWTEFEGGGPPFTNHSGFSEIHLGPKLTFIRKESSETLAALGLVFEVPVGDSDVFQNTGSLSLRPYVSFGQRFWRTEYGMFNFLNTTGVAFGTNSERSDQFFTSFHLSYDVGNLKKIYPLVELHWAHYLSSGTSQPINFEGRDLFNFGSTDVRNLDELVLAFGVRYKWSEAIQFGIGTEFGLMNRDRTLDNFRLTLDFIWRY